MNAPALLLLLHWLAGAVVLVEGLRRLEHLSPNAPGIAASERAMKWADALAWFSLSIGGAGAVITPLLPLEKPTLQDACVLVGLALFVLLKRIKGQK